MNTDPRHYYVRPGGIADHGTRTLPDRCCAGAKSCGRPWADPIHIPPGDQGAQIAHDVMVANITAATGKPGLGLADLRERRAQRPE